jgi:hypothetical protein
MTAKRSTPSLKVRLLQAAFVLDVIFWVALSVGGLVMGARAPGGISGSRLVVSAMMLANAALLAWLAWALARRNRIIYIITVVLIFATAVLSITDEVGLFDLISLAVNLGLLILLFLARGEYRKSASSPVPGAGQTA